MIPADHLPRLIDGAMVLGELRGALASHYSHRGRPSIAPELLIRMALIGRLYGITSERRLREEVRFNLAYRWLCRLALNAPCRTTRRSARTGMATSVMPACFASCSSRRCSAALTRGYAFNVLIDTPGGVAIDVEASPARFAAEDDVGRTMLARAGDRFDYRPKRVAVIPLGGPRSKGDVISEAFKFFEHSSFQR